MLCGLASDTRGPRPCVSHGRFGLMGSTERLRAARPKGSSGAMHLGRGR